MTSLRRNQSKKLYNSVSAPVAAAQDALAETAGCRRNYLFTV